MHIDHFKEHFQTIIDQRQSAKVTYCQFDVLWGSLCAVIAGAKGWFDILEYIVLPKVKRLRLMTKHFAALTKVKTGRAPFIGLVLMRRPTSSYWDS